MLLLASFAALVLIITLGYGFEHRIAEPDWPGYFRLWSAALLVGLIGLGLGFRASEIRTRDRVTIPVWVPPVATAAMMGLTCYFWLPSIAAVSIAAVMFLATCFATWRKRPIAGLAIPLTVNVGLAIALVASTSIDIREADMLPLMKAANTNFLAGLNPYDQQYSNLFFYLPLQWLSYLPFTAAGLDLRLENTVILTCVSLFVIWLVRLGRLDPLGQTLICCLLVSRVGVEMVLRGLVWPYWALVICFGVSMRDNRMIVAAVLLGLLIATQQPMLLAAAMCGVHTLVHRGWRQALLLGGLTAFVWSLAVGPWVIARPTLPYEIYVQIQQVIAGSYAEHPERLWKEISLLNLLQSVGFLGLRTPLQLLLAGIGLMTIILNRGMSSQRLLCLTGIIYVAAISLNVQVYKYYYYPGLFLIAIGLPGQRGETGPRFGS